MTIDGVAAQPRVEEAISRIFPDGVALAVSWSRSAEASPFVEERAAVARAAAARQQEFFTGRACAREALRHLGGPTGPLPRSQTRAPAWPAGFVGSITHTQAVWAAAAATRSRFAAVGLDAELVSAVPQSLAPEILTPRELRWMALRRPAIRQVALAVAFSAKESAFKAQFPLTGLWLDFHDIELCVSRGAFSAACDALRRYPSLHAMHGRFTLRRGHVFTGIVVQA